MPGKIVVEKDERPTSNIQHPPAMHHKRWRYDHCHRAETRRYPTKTTQRHCGQVE
ncbi:MAG: hypothetical protein U9N82_02495 [Thermodesulfobacteriota bacterium]|nr:hypothetical protein [Thermodesulfobacteriota bacterium]